MRKPQKPWRANVRCAKSIWGPIKPTALDALKQITKVLLISVANGDVQLLNNVWYVTHAGLLRIAKRRRCLGIDTAIDEHLSDPNSNRWVFKATVFTVPIARDSQDTVMLIRQMSRRNGPWC